MKRKTYLATLAALSVSAALGTAYASKDKDNDALAIRGAKISLGEAVATAERHMGGKASHAEFEQHNGQGVFEIEIVKGNDVSDVRVDASNGAILAARADKSDLIGSHAKREERED